MTSCRDLREQLADHVDALVRELLPAALKSGGYFHVGGVDGRAGESLYIHRSGPRCGQWSDTATSDQYGDLLDLIDWVICGGHDMVRAMAWARAWLGNERPAVPPREKRAQCCDDDDEAAIAIARRLWHSSRPIEGTLAEKYLRGRAIALPLPPSLRFHPMLKHKSTGRSFPAMVAAISGADGKVTAVLRTYLRLDGLGKAVVNEPKKTLGRMRDGACRLAPAGLVLGLAEGVETALSAMEYRGVACWAACGSRMEAVELPAAVAHLMIFADAGEPGRRAAQRAREAHERPGRKIETREPPSPAEDWNSHAQLRREIMDNAGTRRATLR